MNPQTAHRWYTRPVIFVADVNRAIQFYVDRLGFEKDWHEGDGAGTVCQVARGECEIILCEDAARSGRARLFISLTPEALAELRRELDERSVPSKDSWWGYDVIQVDDPDGNELLFPRSCKDARSAFDATRAVPRGGEPRRLHRRTEWGDRLDRCRS